jgi:hypothetical protein
VDSADTSTALKPAYYSAQVGEFLRADPDAIYGALSRHHAHTQEMAQRSAWLEQIALLQKGLVGAPDAWLAFEFAIPRMGKRADAIVILNGIIFVIEFKVRAAAFETAAIDQVTDYALDLKNFHSHSHSRILVPVIIATEAPARPIQLDLFSRDVTEPVLSNGHNLADLLITAARRYPGQPPISPNEWMASGYKPTPTIIEAAQALYRSHRVDEITRSDAGARNLSVTTARIAAIVEEAKTKNHKAICFVTGVPGAGKTLAGLNLVTQRADAYAEEHAVFLSGNGPLVDVLREALARDEKRRGVEQGPSVTMAEARRKVRSFIQNIHHFRDANLRSAEPPVEHLVVFDEAQRAWDLDKITKAMREKHGIAQFGQSEPQFLIDIMSRHRDWCVVVCLIGGGQEINEGEAGLSEWFAALSQHHRDWKVYTSDHLTTPEYHWGRNLQAMLRGLDCSLDGDLHLAVSVRSFRAEKLSQFINELIAGDASAAAQTYGAIQTSYPIVLTRTLVTARHWLRRQARGSERYGLVASSGALRLKPDGIHVKADVDARNWFLNSRQDVRASYYAEDPATEFDIQGLELDWVGLCWDADFRRAADGWSFHDFVGARWQSVRDQRRQAYLANAYRVLLTRARQGMVIYVPKGDDADHTRPPQFYDGTADYLRMCGIPELVHPEQHAFTTSAFSQKHAQSQT